MASSVEFSTSAADRPPVHHGPLTEFTTDPIACMRRMQNQFGELSALRQDNQQIVFAIGPEWNQRILTDNQTFLSQFFAVRGSRTSSQRRVTSGLLSMNGSEHKQHRRIVMEPFQKRSIANYQPVIESLTREMLDQWTPGSAIDVNREMTELLLRLTSAILFGMDVPEMALRLGQKIERWTHMNHEAGMGAFVSDPVFNQRYEQLLHLAGDLEQSVAELIEHRRQSRQRGCDVLSLLLQAHEQGQSVSVEQLVGHVTLLFGAAHLTTAHTLTWTLFLLSQHPEVLRNLHHEFDDVFGRNALQFEQLPRLAITERILKESMRVLPASAYSQRVNAVPTELGNLHLPPGTPVIFSQYMTHHLPGIYPDPDRFQPDRWKTISPSTYAFLPFGAGPRMCIGASLAMVILKTVLPMVLSRYRLSVVADQEINGQVISTMLGPTTPILMTVHAQDGCFESFPVHGNIHDLVQLHPSLHSRPEPGKMNRAA